MSRPASTSNYCAARKNQQKHKHHLVPRRGLLRIAHVCIGLSKPTQRLLVGATRACQRHSCTQHAYPHPHPHFYNQDHMQNVSMAYAMPLRVFWGGGWGFTCASCIDKDSL